MLILKNSLIALTAGEYSDYGICSILKCIKEFDPDIIADEFKLQDTVSEDDWNNSELDRYTAYLNKNGYIEDVSYFEINLGAYSRLHLDITENKKKE